MTIAERIDALEKELAELKQQIEADVISEYWKFEDGTSYALEHNNHVFRYPWGCPWDTSPNADNNYYIYHTKEYAEMAKEMKEFNDKLLAFKWCYDKDYVPNWDDGNELKYVVVYDGQSKIYRIDSWDISKYNTVHFSKAGIARKCCDWLNGMIGAK